MAEERNLGVARAPEADEDVTKAELQRRMEEARESITQTVSEIKDTVTNQYQYVRESVTEALDWREQYRKRPVAWTLGALGVGLVVGYSLGGTVIGDRDDDDRDYPDYDETDAYGKTGATPAQYAAQQSVFTDHKSYAAAAHAIPSGAYGSSEYAAATPSAPLASAAPMSSATGEDYRPSYSSGYEQTPEEDKPGLIDRFKETRAYDRLQEEVSELGNRFMDELSNAARTVVLPALFNKIKELVGVDLSNKPQGGAKPALGSAPAKSNVQNAAAASFDNQSVAQSQASSSSPVESRSDLNHPAENRTASASTGESSQRSTGFGYDDRYERESQLYARSENRGFGDKGTGTTDATSTNREGTERGGNS
jgi:hypothetical protein